MPNTPGLSGWVRPRHPAATDDTHLVGSGLLGVRGIVVTVNESASTRHSACRFGPACVFLVAEAMIEAGVLVGWRDVAENSVADAACSALLPRAPKARRRRGRR
jgi:pyrroline-5-carboxylate reductase